MSAYILRNSLRGLGLVFVTTVLILQTCCFGKQRTEDNNATNISGIIICLTSRSNPHALSANFLPADSVTLRFTRGVIDEATDKKDEIHLIIYRRDGNAGFLIELQPEKGPDGDRYTEINRGSVAKERTHWVIKETLGGIYSYDRAQRVVDKISASKLVTVSKSELTNTCSGYTAHF